MRVYIVAANVVDRSLCSDYTLTPLDGRYLHDTMLTYSPINTAST